MSLGTLEIRSERLRDTGHLRYRQRELLRQWQSFSGLLRRGLSQSEEYGVATRRNLTRGQLLRAYSF